jgi:hypothetical protein
LKRDAPNWPEESWRDHLEASAAEYKAMNEDFAAEEQYVEPF